MFIEEQGNRKYLKTELFAAKKLAHAFTAKSGGVSRGKIEGLNLGYRCGDDYESVNTNYRLVAQDNGMPFERITASRQTHSANIRIITEADAGKGVYLDSDITDTDGLVTSVVSLPLVVFYADCVPILLCDENAGVVAAVHSGWRGTVSRISENAVEIMVAQFGAKRGNIKAAIGPSIGPCCFETGGEVAELFEDSFKVCLGEKYKVDLWQKNRKILEESGIMSENIEVFEMCTMCHSDFLYSYRCHGEHTGRMGAFIMLRE